MKKILALTAVLILALGCDDGDISFKTFNFSNVTTVSTCQENNLYYKTNGTEALILEISPAELYNIESEFDDTNTRIPREVAISTNGANKITYRNYDGPANTSNLICNRSGLPITSPNVIEEWIGDGTILIETRKDYTNGELTGYIHTITLKEITFNNGNEDIRIVDNPFGDINKSMGFSFNYGNEEDPNVVACNNTTEDRLYKTSGNDVIILNFPADTFVNAAGTAEFNFSEEEENYELLFKVYSGTANASIVCDLDITIDIEQRWRASSGTAIVVTTENDLIPGEFRHEIRLKDVEFTRTDITSGETFTLYEVLSVENAETAIDEGGFLLGTYITQE